MTYLITFACYGNHLHGEARGSVNRHHNIHRSGLVEENPGLLRAEREKMDQPAYQLVPEAGQIVLAALKERCLQQHWDLLAAHVRTNHVHVVVEGETRPERIMNDLKSYSSRCLNMLRMDAPGRKRWARHGSTRWLWKPEQVAAAIRYAVHEQGEPMAVFEALES